MKLLRCFRLILICILAVFIFLNEATAELQSDIYYLLSESKFSVQITGLNQNIEYCLLIASESPSDSLQPTDVHYIRQLSSSVEGTLSFVLIDDMLSGCSVWLNSEKLCDIDKVTISSQLTIPGTTETIAESAYENGDFSYVILCNGVKTISSRAFADCRELHWMEIPASVTQISQDAFEGCGSLTFICVKGSFAESYAKSCGLSIQYQ